MTGFEHEHQVDPTDYGRQRREAWLVGMQARADDMMAMLSGAGHAGHQAAHDHITRSTHGVLGAQTPYQRGQDVSEIQATVGGDWGQARPIQRLGGTLDTNDGPRPHRVDL